MEAMAGLRAFIYSPDADEFSKVNPEFKHIFGEKARAIVSEPPGNYPQIWTEVPQNTLVAARDGELEFHSFKPKPMRKSHVAD